MSDERKIIKKIKSTGAMRQLMGEYFKELDEAARTGSAKVAWCTSVGPAELLRAFGFEVYFPENHGAMLGATRMAADLIPAANAIGYSPDICSYLTSDVGSYLKSETPLTRGLRHRGRAQAGRAGLQHQPVPRRARTGSRSTSREFDVPMHRHRHPPRHRRDHGRPSSTDLAGQHRGADPDARGGRRATSSTSTGCSEVVGLVVPLHRAVEGGPRAGRASPVAADFFDGTIHMGPAVVLRGDPRADRLLRDAAAPSWSSASPTASAPSTARRYRIYWEGMPVWGKLREPRRAVRSQQACVVASTYCNSWIFEDLDPDDPFESMARAYTELFIVPQRGLQGAVHRAAWSRTTRSTASSTTTPRPAPTTPTAATACRSACRKELGMPYVMINGDLNDLRLYSEEQARTQIEAFVEQLHGSAASVATQPNRCTAASTWGPPPPRSCLIDAEHGCWCAGGVRPPGWTTPPRRRAAWTRR